MELYRNTGRQRDQLILKIEENYDVFQSSQTELQELTSYTRTYNEFVTKIFAVQFLQQRKKLKINLKNNKKYSSIGQIIFKKKIQA